jgi:hypothetical protein
MVWLGKFSEGLRGIQVYTVCIAHSEVVLCARVSAPRRHGVEIRCLVLIRPDAPAFRVAGREPALRRGVPELGRLAQKVRGHGCVPVDALSAKECEADTAPIRSTVCRAVDRAGGARIGLRAMKQRHDMYNNKR